MKKDNCTYIQMFWILQKIFAEIDFENKGVGFSSISLKHLADWQKLSQGVEAWLMGWKEEWSEVEDEERSDNCQGLQKYKRARPPPPSSRE